jgi:hypothetical protein
MLRQQITILKHLGYCGKVNPLTRETRIIIFSLHS